MRRMIAEAFWFVGNLVAPPESVDTGVYSVLWVGGWMLYEGGFEPSHACCLGEEADLEAGLARMHREAPAAMNAHDGKGQVVLMDPKNRQAAAWRGERRPQPATA